jgi:maleamate amidohydrolase
MPPRVWDSLLSELDRAVYRDAGYGQRGGGGARPALLVVDVTYDFVGDRPEPILESIKKFRNSCGEVGWQGMHAIRALLDVARQQHIPIFFTKGMDVDSELTRGSWAWKNSRALERGDLAARIGNQIPDLIAPQPDELVIQKPKPSAFFGTPLASYLVGLGVDTVLVTGTTTSGCVRATVVDAFSNNFHTVVVEDGVFDRGELPHKANLFDMHAKYADVISLDEAITYLTQPMQARAPATSSAQPNGLMR